MGLFTMSSCLTMNEWNELKLVTNETVRLKNKTSFLFFLIFILLVLFFLTNEVVQDWMKYWDLESRAEIKLIDISYVVSAWISCLSFHRRGWKI